MLVFDNWRVLHGRSAFNGKRRICGGYGKFLHLFSLVKTFSNAIAVNRDDFISRFRILNWGQGEVLRTIGTA